MTLREQFESIRTMDQLYEMKFWCGKYEGKSYLEIRKEDPKYIYFLMTGQYSALYTTVKPLLEQDKSNFYLAALDALIKDYQEKIRRAMYTQSSYIRRGKRELSI